MRGHLIALTALTAGLLALNHLVATPPNEPPPADIPGIVFVGDPIFDETAHGGDGVYQAAFHWRDGYIYPRGATYHKGERTLAVPRPGRNLYALVPARPDGKLTRLTHLKSGAVFKPHPSFDGKKVLFSMRRDGEDWFHQCEINVDGTGLRQLTDGPFNDHSGVYLPDGRIVYCSDRAGYLDEYHEERTEVLFVMNADGTGIQQITFAPGTYFEPTVLRDGRILFSFWDMFHIDVPPFDKHETYLMTVKPDGTEERHLFGAGQYRYFGRERHSGVGLTQPREMPDGRILVQSEMGPSLLDLGAGLAVKNALTPIFPGTTSIQTGGTTHRVHLSPLGTRSTAYPLQDGRILYSVTEPGARDSAIWVCHPDTREEKLVINLPNWAEFDAVPVLVERPKPATLPEKTHGLPPVGLAKFLVIAGHTCDSPERTAAMKKARFFRVIEAEYTGVTTSSHTNLETRILGTVPILPDGSAYFEAPADTPLFLDPLDNAGNRILMDWPFANTSVEKGLPYPATQMSYMVGRPGEMKACYGCHAPQTTAVPDAAPEALRWGPVKVMRTSTDLQYRRNDPEGYRRQARLGEEEKYRGWLQVKNPTVRARGCEMLMHLDDDAAPTLARLEELLNDSAVEVRRAAALALTRLATPRQQDALSKAQGDKDWQTRFAAAAALEAIQDFTDPAAVSAELRKNVQDVRAIRAAGRLKMVKWTGLLAEWLTKHEYEYHAAEAAIALGRMGTKEAGKALLAALRKEVPNKKVHITRYLQHGPRPEEYALLRGLLLAMQQGAVVLDEDDLFLLFALLPNAFMEKPRYEDRLRDESQRVTLPRLILQRQGLRRRAVDLLVESLKGNPPAGDKLYQQILKGVNLERPFNEHGRPFPVVTKLGAEEALWLLGCLTDSGEKIDSEELIASFFTSKNHRERIDAAVLLGRVGFGPKAAKALAAEVAKPYDFSEIASIGKGMPDDRFRDKAYFVYTLAQHVEDVAALKPFADPMKMYRDIRHGLARGLAVRGKADAIPLLADMAMTDPITLVRQQARYAIEDIQDGHRLLSKPVPDVKWPANKPLEAWYPPRPVKWADTTFVELPKVGGPLALKDLLAPAHFRNLNFAQSTGAQQMLIRKVEETRVAFTWLAKLPAEARRKELVQALGSSYPYARYQAAKILGEVGDKQAIPTLVNRLETAAAAGDTVGFWWCTEALGRMGAKEAVGPLAKFAVVKAPSGTFGPEGMALGYPSARALARIVADVKHAEVQRLLASENVWLRAGALRGLAEAKAAGVETLLKNAAAADQPAMLRQEAQVQLRRMGV
jgi:HEAT repeat protein